MAHADDVALPNLKDSYFLLKNITYALYQTFANAGSFGEQLATIWNFISGAPAAERDE